MALLFAGCGETGLGPYQSKLFRTQQFTCYTESRGHLPDYTDHHGDRNPMGYAIWAAQHGAFRLRNHSDFRIAVKGCLKGLKGEPPAS